MNDMNNTYNEKLMTISQLTEVIQISRTTLWGLTKAGKIPHYKVGRNYRYSLTEVLNSMKGNNEN